MSEGNTQKHATMKTTKLFTLLALLMVFAVGCNKPDEPNNGGNNNGGNGDNSLNGHEYVDLGLPSGTLWATCNVGADKPEDSGDYFAWGETQSKSVYDWNTYMYSYGQSNQITKYCNRAEYGYNGFTDNLTILLPSDDAATINWGRGFHTCTLEEWKELYENCTYVWTTINGVNGCCFTGNNGNTLFLPASGYCLDGEIYMVGNGGCYWTSLLHGSPDEAISFFICSNYPETGATLRFIGRTIRPVYSEK